MRLIGAVNNRVGHKLHNDCTQRAVSSVTGIDYWVVCEAFKLEGQRHGCGFHIRPFFKRVGNVVFGFRFTPRPMPSYKGKFLLWNKGHAWAIIDGVKHDYGGSRACQFTECFEVEPLEPGAVDLTEDLLTKAKFLASRKYDQD